MRTILSKLVAPVLAAAALLMVAAPTAVAFAEAPPDATTTEVEASANGRVALHGTGRLEARGTGNAILAGHLRTSGSAFGGTLTVIDHAGDAVIRVEAGGPRTSALDAARGGTTVTISGLNGQFEISGSRVEIRFHDTRIHLFAAGTGHAVLSGHGWYRVNGGRLHRWASPA